jgi:cardiolipin synthase
MSRPKKKDRQAEKRPAAQAPKEQQAPPEKEPAGSPWREEVIDRRDEVLTQVWAGTGRTLPRRAPRPGGRLWQSEEDGALRARLVELVDEAREIVLVCSFLLSDEALEQALLRAADRGVRVYMLASEARLDREGKAEGEFEARVLAQHKALLDRLAGRVLMRSAEHFHAKFLVTDPRDATPRGLLLTANLTAEALCRNPELAVELTAAQARSLARLFAHAFYGQAQRELLAPRRLTSVARHDLGEAPWLDGLCATAAGTQTLKEHALSLIRRAKESLLVASFGFGYEEVMQALCEKARAGVPVTILARPRPALSDALSALAQAGARVVGLDYLHAKALCADGRDGLVMTANLDEQSLRHGFEVGVPLDGADAAALHEHLRGWAEAAPWAYRDQVRLGDLGPGPVLLRDGTRDEVRAEQVVEETRVARCATDLLAEGAPAPAPQGSAPRPPGYYHRLRVRYQVAPPRLAPGARAPEGKASKGGSVPFAVYQEPPGGRRVLAVKGIDQVRAAARYLQAAQAEAVVLQG